MPPCRPCRFAPRALRPRWQLLFLKCSTSKLSWWWPRFRQHEHGCARVAMLAFDFGVSGGMKCAPDKRRLAINDGELKSASRTFKLAIGHTAPYMKATTDSTRNWASVAERRDRAPASKAGERAMHKPAPASANNEFLSGLADADFECLRPHLKAAELRHEAVLFDAGSPIPMFTFRPAALSRS